MSRIARRSPLGIILLLASVSQAVAGASLWEPRPAHTGVLTASGLNVGFWASSSQPTGGPSGLLDNSSKTGLSLTWMRSRTIGVGVGMDYCRWRYPDGGVVFDRIFSGFGGTPIHGTQATISGLRATVRGMTTPLPDAFVVPWVQFGGGICRLNRKLVFPVSALVNSGWQVTASGTRNISYSPIVVGGLGFDVQTNEFTRVGFDVMGEVLYIQDEKDPITALSIGGHVLFGRWPGR